MKKTQSNSESVRPKKSRLLKVFPNSILLISLILTCLATYYTKIAAEDKVNKELYLECSEIRSNVYSRLHAHAQLLRSGAAFFEASDSVSRSEWETFVTHQQISKNLPGVQGIGYVQLIAGKQLKNHEKQIQSQGFRGYKVFPKGERNTYTPIVYIEPFTDRNLRAFGYDMFSEPIRRSAMQTACDSDFASLSSKVALVQETNTDIQAGTLMLVPVYKRGMSKNTVLERRKSLKGWIYCPFRMNDMMQGILGRHDSTVKERIRLQIYDTDSITAKALLFDSQASISALKNESRLVKVKLPVNFNGKYWTLYFTQPMPLYSYYLKTNVLIVFWGGTIVSILVFLFALSWRKERLQHKVTTQLSVNLKEALEKQWALFNAIPDAVFVTDFKTGHIEEVNNKASNQYGYSYPELTALNESDLTLLQEQSSVTENPHITSYPTLIHRKKDGTNIPVEITSSTFEIDNSKKNILVARDITERIKAEEALQTSEALYKSIIQASPDNITVTDLEGLIVMVSPAAIALFGLQNESQLKGRSFLDCLSPKERQRASSILKVMLTSEERRPLDFELIHTEGRLIYTEINGEVIRNANYQPTGYVFIIRDCTQRRQAEEELRESEEKWRSLVSNTPDFVALHDSEGRYLFLNHFAKGYSEKDLLGHTAFEFISPEYSETFRLKHQECISQWKPVKFNHVAVGNNGEMRIYEESLVPLLTKNKEINVLAVAKDITEQRQSELRLQESEEHFRLIFEEGAIAMALVNADFRFTQVNKAFIKFLGYTEEELMNKTFVDITDPEHAERDLVQIKRLLNREIDSYHTEKKYITSDRKTVWGLVQVSKMLSKSGDFRSLLVMIDNITERKEAEKSLLQSEEIFNQFLLNSPIYVFFKDDQIRSLRLSRNFEQMLGRPLDELIGKNMYDLFPTDFARKIVNDDKRVLQEGKQIEMEEAFNGRFYFTIKFPIIIEGKPIYLAGYTIDITERKLSDDLTKATLKEKEILLREIHHRVKNNLQVVSSLLNLQANNSTDNIIKDTLSQSRNRIRSIALVHEKLYQSGSFAEINFKEYTKSLVSELFRLYVTDPSKISIRTEIEDINIPLIYAIPCGLIMNEIISNSLKYAFPKNHLFKLKPELHIYLKTLPNNHIQMIAGDNGIGLPANYQLTDSSSLGLYLIHILSTEQLDGKLEISNKKGTIFTITFNPFHK